MDKDLFAIRREHETLWHRCVWKQPEAREFLRYKLAGTKTTSDIAKMAEAFGDAKVKNSDLAEIVIQKIHSKGHYHETLFSRELYRETWKFLVDTRVYSTNTAAAKIHYQKMKNCEEGLAKLHINLVRSVAKKWLPYGLYDDAVQEGSLGLLRAIEKYDWIRANTFSTFAVPWITTKIGRAFKVKGNTIAVPLHVRNIAYKVKKLSTLMGARTLNEVAKEIDEDPANLHNILQISSQCVELDANEHSDQALNMACDSPATPEDIAHTTSVREGISEALDMLTKKERYIIQYRFGLNPKSEVLSLAQIGNKLDLSKERIRQIECSSILKMRKSLT